MTSKCTKLNFVGDSNTRMGALLRSGLYYTVCVVTACFAFIYSNVVYFPGNMHNEIYVRVYKYDSFVVSKFAFTYKLILN